MAHVVLFHHVQGLTDGVQDLAHGLRPGGHEVHTPWPEGLAAQIHGMEGDPFSALEGDLGAAWELVASVGADRAEPGLYRGDRHLFTDSSLPAYDPENAALVLGRSLAFPERLS